MEHDLVEAALEAEAALRQASCLTPMVGSMRSLADLQPQTLAIMHGSSFRGDGSSILDTLADAYEQQFMPEDSFVIDRGQMAQPPPEKGGAAAITGSPNGG